LRGIDRSCPFGITTLISCNKSAQLIIVLGSVSLYQRFEKRKNHSSETIKISFILPQSGGEAAAKASPAPLVAGLGERMSSSEIFEFVPSNAAAELKRLQTFDIILPNLIHKSKKRNLKKR